MKTPLVTISIPTLNSAKHLEMCLEAIKAQSYKRIEVNIVDGYSKDKTIEIAKKFGVDDIIFYDGSLLGARYEGVKNAKGEYVLILDSDQVLEKTAIERAVKLSQVGKYRMLVFEEDVYRSDTFIEKLFKMDRLLFNKVNDLDPFTGVILPRFFDTHLLKKVYSNIPKNIFRTTGGPDHAIVYYEAWLIDKKVAILPQAVRHIEPSTVKEVWRKFYRWGYTSTTARSLDKYDELMRRKERFRTGLFTKGLYLESLGSITLLVLKGIAYKYGYVVARLKSMYAK